MDTQKILSLEIKNLKPITLNSKVIGFRGGTLSAPKKQWMLKEIKECSIHTYVDLRAGDHQESFPQACKNAGIKYIQLPTDKLRTPDAVVISNLFTLIDVIAQGGFYISCALGLHRTDIALALHYIFNPKINEPPVLYALLDDGIERYQDIFRRAGRVYRCLSERDKERLGWDESFDWVYIRRKKALKDFQQEGY